MECQFCQKTFSNKANLQRHQKTAQNCLQTQGKTESIEMMCENCNKTLAAESYKRHKLKCDQVFAEDNKIKNELLQHKITAIDKIKFLEEELATLKNKMSEELTVSKDKIRVIEIENTDYKQQIAVLQSEKTLLVQQNEKLLKLAEKTTTINTQNIMINTTQPLTNDVLRKCASTFSLANAYNANGIAVHMANSLQDHINCTDASRDVFKYINDKDEEIIDKGLEHFIPEYLGAVKDHNNFMYDEVIKHFKNNNIDINRQTDYHIFYNTINEIIAKKCLKNKYTEKCKREIVKECKKRFLEKNRNKEKVVAKPMSIDEVMTLVIESDGGTNDFVNRYFTYDMETETDEQMYYRREMEDVFRRRRKEWLQQHTTLTI
jgi:hypothetical protein